MERIVESLSCTPETGRTLFSGIKKKQRSKGGQDKAGMASHCHPERRHLPSLCPPTGAPQAHFTMQYGCQKGTPRRVVQQSLSEVNRLKEGPEWEDGEALPLRVRRENRERNFP